MNQQINIQTFTPGTISDTLPERLRKDWLPGYLIKSISGQFGDLAVQWVRVKGISVCYITGELQEDMRFKLVEAGTIVFISVLLQGEITIQYKRQIQQLKRTDRFSLFYFPNQRAEVSIANAEENSGFRSLIFAYPVSFFQSILVSYPWLQNLNERLDSGTEITNTENHLSASVSEKIYQLLHTPFAPNMEDYFYQLLKQFMVQILETYTTDANEKVPFGIHDLSCIHEAKEYIDHHLPERITIEQLSRKVGINQLKLKKGFKSVYGLGVHGYQIQQRLTIAKMALEKSVKPIYQIARQAGYKANPNFSAAFKKFFGITPYQHRKKIRNQ